MEMLPIQPDVRTALQGITTPIILGLSGGADSIAALYTTLSYFPDCRLIAGHFNHGLRGKDSDDDADFCRSVCRSLNVTYEEQTWGAPEKSEGKAREARMAFLSGLLQKHNTKYFITGHHLNDVAETMLMRLVRGSGCDGLSAPRPVHLNAIGIALRPLLICSKAQIEQWLTRKGLPWCTDTSNHECTYTRNVIRLQVLPQLLAVDARDGLQALSSGRALLEEESRALEFYADQYPVTPTLDVRQLRSAPTNTIRRVLHRWLLLHKVVISRAGLDSLIIMVQTRKRSNFSIAGGFIRLAHGSLSKLTND